MRTTSLAVLSALSLLLAGGAASAQSRLTLNDDGSTPRKETTRLALATDTAGPILQMPQRTAQNRRAGLPALRRKSRTASASSSRGDVRISQVPRNALPGESSEPAYPQPPLLRRSPNALEADRLGPPQPPPELTGEDELPGFLREDEAMPTLRAQPDDLEDDEPPPPLVEGYPADDGAVINHPYQGATADFFLPPRPCVIHDYWTGYCSEGYGGHWLHALGWGNRFRCRTGHCRTGHCGCGNGACQGDCGCDHAQPTRIPEPEVEDDLDTLLPPAPRPPRNEIPQVRGDDDRPPKG